MASEKTEPRTGLILKIGAFAAVSLIAIRAGLVSYFDDMADKELYRKVGSMTPGALVSLRADEKARLGAGPMPIEKAMDQLKAKGRTGASPDIMPSASKDVAPLQGWSKLPLDVPPAMTAPPPPPPPETLAPTDAGAATSVIDGAVARVPAPDAGRTKKP